MHPEQIRILCVARTGEVGDTLRRLLPEADGYVMDCRDTLGWVPTAQDPDAPDAIVVELTGDNPAGEVLQLPEAHHCPVLIIAPPEEEERALLALQGGCTDYLLTTELRSALLQRTVGHAVQRARTEQHRRTTETALKASEERYRSLFEQSRDAIYMADESGEILEANPAALELLGYGWDELQGKPLRELYADPADWHQFVEEMEEQGHVRDLEVRLDTRDTGTRWCLVSGWHRRNPDGERVGYQGIIHDITERKAVEEQLTHEAFHDSLTGLPNRALFMDRLERAVARRRRGEERDLAVLFLDMDRFKVVNDSLGHLAGDELLRLVGRLLVDEVREEDTVARIGGDEFAILLDGVDDPSDPTHVAERIQTRFRTPITIGGQDIFTSMSIGITFGGAEVMDPEELLGNADTAMYRAKELGPARYQIFDEAMHAHAVSLLQLETDLRLALDRDQLTVHYQPLLDIDADRVAGFEALVRWQHPEQGLLLPKAFIPVAEETGLIVPLGEWVLRTALRQLREWLGTHPDLFVSVNLSARQFTAPELADTVQQILHEEQVNGSRLRLEITESAMMKNPATAITTLQRLRELGVILCIDDFGTGYSSLHTLHELPIDILKIDRSFISRLEDTDEGQVVETILALARNFGMEAVAEGVETEAQLSTLRSLGSRAVQGFLFSMPLEAPEVDRLLKERAH